MLNASKRIWFPILAAAVCLVSAQAQQQQPPPTNPGQPSQPVQPITNPENKQPASKGEPASPVQTTPPVVTGGLTPSIGEVSEERNNVRFGFQVGEFFDSNFPGVTVPGKWNEITNFGGHIDLHRMGRSSDLMFRYAGGGLLDPQTSGLNTTYHQFEAGEMLQFRHWSLRLDDLFSYLPDSSFGFQLYGVTQSNLGNVTLLNPSVPPSQSILTTQSMRLSNVFLAQAQIDASQRTSFTFTAGYGLLHFMTAGFFDPTNYNVGFGYNYALNARDVLGVSYQYNNYTFNPTSASIEDSTVLVSYGHHINGRWAFQVGVGPELNFFKPTAGSASISKTLISANAGLTYRFNRTMVSASFTRGITGGSGILSGSSADTAQVSASYQVGRKTTVLVNAGYSFNESLPQQSPTATTYSSFYGGAGLDYKFSRGADFFVNYNYLRQLRGGPVCVGVACAVNFSRNQIWVGINFDFRPIPIY